MFWTLEGRKMRYIVDGREYRVMGALHPWNVYLALRSWRRMGFQGGRKSTRITDTLFQILLIPFFFCPTGHSAHIHTQTVRWKPVRGGLSESIRSEREIETSCFFCYTVPNAPRSLLQAGFAARRVVLKASLMDPLKPNKEMPSFSGRGSSKLVSKFLVC